MTVRQTQEARRAKTTLKLLNATIDSLAVVGYARTTINSICKRAGVSQGALFNYYGTRHDVIVAATEHICDQHVQELEAVVRYTKDRPPQVLELVQFVRQRVKTPMHAAWHEVMVAARTDETLRVRVAVALERFEQTLICTGAEVFGLDARDRDAFGVVLLSVLHMFDSEAVTTAVFPNPAIEQAREAWVTQLLTRSLNQLGHQDA